MSSGRKIKKTFVLTSIAAVLAVPASAQDAGSAFRGTINSTTTADFESNKNLSAVAPQAELSISEILALSVLTENRTQKLAFDASGGVTFNTISGGGLGAEFSTPSASLKYSREAANAYFELNGSLGFEEVATIYDIDPSIFVNLIYDVGLLERGAVATKLEFGKGGPAEFSFSASYDSHDYKGTTDPALIDFQNANVSVGTKLRLSPVTSGDFSLGWSHYNSADQFSTEKETNSAKIKITHEIRSALKLSGELGYKAEYTTATNGDTTSDGLTLGVGFSQAYKSGDIFGEIGFDQSSGETTLSFGGRYDLKDGYASASVKAVDQAASGPLLLLNANYQKEFSDGGFSVGLSQSLTKDSSNQDSILSSVSLGYSKQINQTSGVNLSFDLGHAANPGGGPAGSISRTTLKAEYAKNITPDWDLSLGVQHRTYATNGATPASSAGVFLTLSRDIDFGF